MNAQNSGNYPGNTHTSHTVVVMGNRKSMVTAILLTFFFGPLGLIYVSAAGGIILIILTSIIGVLTLGIGLVLGWIISIIWAIVAVSRQNNRLDTISSNAHNFAPNNKQTAFNQSQSFVQPNNYTTPTPHLEQQSLQHTSNFQPITQQSNYEQAPSLDSLTNQSLEETILNKQTITPPIIEFKQESNPVTVPPSASDNESKISHPINYTVNEVRPVTPRHEINTHLSEPKTEFLVSIGDWFQRNHKGLIALVLSLIFLLFLMVAIKYVFSLDFNSSKDKMTIDKTSTSETNSKNRTTLTEETTFVSSTYQYNGSIAGIPVHLEFSTTGLSDCSGVGSTFEGYYYYEQYGPQKKVEIRGNYCNDNIQFDEISSKGKKLGNFSGTMNENIVGNLNSKDEVLACVFNNY